MSELFTGITFPQQKVTPSDDATIYRAALADGILSGCDLSYAGSTLTMGAGQLLGCGRQFRHTAVQNWAVTGANSGYARLVLTIDTTRASTKDSFDQIVDTIEYASSLDGFLQLQQDDINEAGTIYQIAVCVVSLGAGGITGIVEKLGSPGKYVDETRVVNNFTTTKEGFVADARALKVLNDIKLSMELLWKNASPTSSFAAQTIAASGKEGDMAIVDTCIGTDNNNTLSANVITVKIPFGESMSAYVGGSFERKYTFNSSGIVVADSTSGNGKGIPLRIWIIKGVSA